ncbi:hypothetical protein GCM10010255_14950 [Streptomyces coeruleofuscus]|uniref:Uncharacterized protein n=1 Tax=Streptomyces coeruleofuscus TaxID=66879 RepID=A0ABP5UYM8_9ACTN
MADAPGQREGDPPGADTEFKGPRPGSGVAVRQSLYGLGGNPVVRDQPVVPAFELSAVAYVRNSGYHRYSPFMMSPLPYRWERHEAEELEPGERWDAGYSGRVNLRDRPRG